jgi:hypothetical protein
MGEADGRDDRIVDSIPSDGRPAHDPRRTAGGDLDFTGRV